MKINRYLLFPVLLISCSSHASDGKNAAKNENRCAEKCIKFAQKLGSDVVNHFNPKDYSLRSQAVDAYKKQFMRIGEDYHNDMDVAKIQKSKLRGKDIDCQERFALWGQGIVMYLI